MTTLRIQRGVPASGKSTEAKNWVAESPNTRIRVNRDDIRVMLGCFPFGSKEQESNVTKVEYASIKAGLSAGLDVVEDATNLRASNVKRLMQLAYDSGAEVEFKDFPIGHDAAMERDRNRAFDGKPSVGAKVMKSFFDRYIGRDGYSLPEAPELPIVTTNDYPIYVPSDGLPSCIIVDIDGTLAHMTGRSPYDPTKYHEDILDETIAEMVATWGLIHDEGFVFIMSGRNEDYEEATVKWLAKNNVTYDALFMRPSSQPQTKDAIVKNELFEKHIAGQYNVDFILDDRNQVVNMWRSKGLKVLQVADGDF